MMGQGGKTHHKQHQHEGMMSNGSSHGLYKRGNSSSNGASRPAMSSSGYASTQLYSGNNTSKNSSSQKTLSLILVIAVVLFLVGTFSLHELASEERRRHNHQRHQDLESELYRRRYKQEHGNLREEEYYRRQGDKQALADDNSRSRWSSLDLTESSWWYRSLRDTFDVTHGNIQQEEYNATLRQINEHNRLVHVNQLRQSQHATTYIPVPPSTDNKEDAYDVYNCPPTPPPHYPRSYPLTALLQNWNPDDVPPIPPASRNLYMGICIFDYTKPHHYQMAQTYRQAELPFVLQNHPQVLQTVQRWNAPNYMFDLLRHDLHRTEYSHSNHFMYWKTAPNQQQQQQQRERRGGRYDRIMRKSGVQQPQGWTEPTQNIEMDFPTWFAKANLTYDVPPTDKNNDPLATHQDHYYFRLNGCIPNPNAPPCTTTYLFDELPFFLPQPSFFIIDPTQHRGINCRFGMRGNIAENHFDQSRNFIMVYKGARRYILSHPQECENLALYPKRHPSGRHSAVDWSNETQWEEFKKFQWYARSNEVVLQAGDALYLPTFWFHYIVSLEGVNYQCNTRSGMTGEFREVMRECGFGSGGGAR